MKSFATPGQRFVTDLMGPAATVLAICLAIFGRNCGNCSGASRLEAQRQAATWAKEVGIQADKIVCVGSDSDGDGYLSCTFVVDKALVSYECAGAYNFNTGCRVPKLVPWR